MTSIFLLIVISLAVGIAAFIVFIYSSKHKQFEDIEGPKYRMLNDDDEDDDGKQNK